MDSRLVIVILICVCISVGTTATCTAVFMLFSCSVSNISVLFVEIYGHKNSSVTDDFGHYIFM